MRESDGPDPDDLPEITVRIPGTWGGPEDLGKTLPLGYCLGEGCLHLPCGDRVGVTALPPDRDFPDIFIRACRRPLEHRDRYRVRRYGVNVCLVRQGGSPDAARRMLRAAGGVVAAGGLGVFVDNSGNGHFAQDWLGLACDPDDAAAIPAFVGVYSDGKELWSVGMHVLGLHDAVMPCSGDDQADVTLFNMMLTYTMSPDRTITPGDFMGDGFERSFRVHRAEHPRIPPGTSPMHNPYGCWRLEPLGGGQPPEGVTNSS